MASSDNGNQKEQGEESYVTNTNGQVPLHISTSQRMLLNDENTQRRSLRSFMSPANRIKFFKFGSASAKFKRIAEERDEVSRLVASSSGHRFRERLTGVFAKKIDWVSLMKMSKQWIKDPMNMALFVWIMCVAISGAILFLVMTGMLNAVLPKKSQRDAWFEVNNQILNALFTLMCLYQHPKRFYHLVLLCRWKPEDISRLRKIYCKNGTYKPHEWAHMMVVIVLLHINCFAQYALCGLNLGYRRSERPAIGVGICVSVAIAAPAMAGVYTIVSPLGKDYDSEIDEEAQRQIDTRESERPEQLRRQSLEKRYSFASGGEERIVESRPLWSGGIFDFWDDISLAYLSLFCSFCVFGWNMERLGFGNMYVHIATFLLFCMAPFWIFNLAAVNIDNETVREALSVTGIVLCMFGLLYGGFWRIQMRKRFNLPAYDFCCGQPAVSDCTLWLFCCWCALAQEARTGNSYDIVEDKFMKKQMDNGNQQLISPLPREDGIGQFSPWPSSSPGYNSSPSTRFTANSSSSRIVSKEYYSPDRQLSVVKEESSLSGKDETMIPPTPSLVQREAT
ncbi:PLAC8 family protein [Theobroma cacao]|uniref:PLAC8 family protein n=1 Tax=Theobroma cacao TaxID=3641 RepID=A0A061FL59_THECC|nr:PLAC8 family protein [Theobroma cacao]